MRKDIVQISSKAFIFVNLVLDFIITKCSLARPITFAYIPNLFEICGP